MCQYEKVDVCRNIVTLCSNKEKRHQNRLPILAGIPALSCSVPQFSFCFTWSQHFCNGCKAYCPVLGLTVCHASLWRLSGNSVQTCPNLKGFFCYTSAVCCEQSLEPLQPVKQASDVTPRNCLLAICVCCGKRLHASWCSQACKHEWG